MNLREEELLRRIDRPGNERFDEPYSGQWRKTAAGFALTVRNPPDHLFDPDGERIVGIVVPVGKYRTTYEVFMDEGEYRGTYRTFEEAKAALVKATGVNA